MSPSTGLAGIGHARKRLEQTRASIRCSHAQSLTQPSENQKTLSRSLAALSLTRRFRIIGWICPYGTYRRIDVRDNSGGLHLPNIKSAAKRMRQAEKRRLRNRAAT